MNQDNFLKELGRSYIVSAFFPSAFFVTLGILLFRGFIPKALAIQFASTKLSEWGGQWLVSVFVIFWVAFFLYSANDVTVKLFEGYFMPEFMQEFLKVIKEETWLKKSTVEEAKYRQMEMKLEVKRQKGKDPTLKFLGDFFNQWRRARKEIQRHEMLGPFEKENLLPTRLGNVLRASEVYANERYFIEELTIWPRLVPLMPPEFTKALEEKNNHLMFLLNSTLLAYINGLLSLGFALLGVPCGLFPNSGLCGVVQSNTGFFYIGYDNINPTGLLIISFVLFGFGYLLYCVSVNVAQGMGAYIRSAFDLYREDLLRQLNWKLPLTLTEERVVWEAICLFYSTGERIKKAEFPPYKYYEKPAPTTDAAEDPD